MAGKHNKSFVTGGRSFLYGCVIIFKDPNLVLKGVDTSVFQLGYVAPKNIKVLSHTDDLSAIGTSSL